MSINQEAGVMERPSKIPFGPTLERLVNTIEAAGMMVFAKIDHSAGAREINAKMPPTVVLIYGHPRGGTPIILAEPRAALDLPLRVLVREDTEGQTQVSFHPIGPILRQAGVPGELSAALDPAKNFWRRHFCDRGNRNRRPLSLARDSKCRAQLRRSLLRGVSRCSQV